MFSLSLCLYVMCFMSIYIEIVNTEFNLSEILIGNQFQRSFMNNDTRKFLGEEEDQVRRLASDVIILFNRDA